MPMLIRLCVLGCLAFATIGCGSSKPAVKPGETKADVKVEAKDGKVDVEVKKP